MSRSPEPLPLQVPSFFPSLGCFRKSSPGHIHLQPCHDPTSYSHNFKSITHQNPKSYICIFKLITHHKSQKLQTDAYSNQSDQDPRRTVLVPNQSHRSTTIEELDLRCCSSSPSNANQTPSSSACSRLDELCPPPLPSSRRRHRMQTRRHQIRARHQQISKLLLLLLLGCGDSGPSSGSSPLGTVKTATGSGLETTGSGEIQLAFW